MQACTLVLHHSQKFDLVVDEAESSDLGMVTAYGETHQSLGTYRVLTSRGEETRQKILLEDPDPASVTTIDIPEGYEDTPVALTHLAAALLDRHAPGEAITGVSSPNNTAFAQRIAALMGVAYVEEVSA